MNLVDFNFNQYFRINPETRMKDYIQALKYWLSYQEPKIVNIVFVENSGHEIEPLRKIVETHNQYDRKIEFIQIKPTNIPIGIHYGYAELEMIDEAISRSTLIPDTPYFIKVTGRIYFPRLSKLINSTNSSFSFLSDSRDYAIVGKQKRYVVTTLLLIKLDFYKSILYGARHMMCEEGALHFETLYYNILKPISLKNSRIILRFPFNVDPVGYGAHWNVNYNSFPKKLESVLRGLTRFFLPAFRI